MSKSLLSICVIGFILLIFYISVVIWLVCARAEEEREYKVERTRLLMQKLTIKSYMDNPPLDAWGNPICFGNSNWISSGPDGRVGTDDDILVPLETDD